MCTLCAFEDNLQPRGYCQEMYYCISEGWRPTSTLRNHVLQTRPINWNLSAQHWSRGSSEFSKSLRFVRYRAIAVLVYGRIPYNLPASYFSLRDTEGQIKAVLWWSIKNTIFDSLSKKECRLEFSLSYLSNLFVYSSHPQEKILCLLPLEVLRPPWTPLVAPRALAGASHAFYSF